MELYYHTMISYFYKKPTKIQEWIKMARTKNTHAFQSDIKHYDKIRDILRYLYMYGSSSKEELVEKKLSKSISSFYDTKQRIENYIDGEYLQEHKSKEKGSGKKYRFMYDPFICPVNYLADTYQNCSYVIDDFIFYFCLMQTFTDPDFRQKPYEYASNEYGEEYDEIDDCMDYMHEFTINDLITTIQIVFDTNQDLLEKLNGIPGNTEHSELLFTLPKVRARIQELSDIGIFVNTSKDTYRLSDDIFADLDADELKDVQLMTQFFYNCSFLTIPGYYLSSTICEYMQSNFIEETDSFFNKQENPVFFYKNHRLQNVIDDDITCTVLDAIHNTNAIQYKYRTKGGSLKDCTVLPMKLVIDYQYGRQYFFCYDYEHKVFNMQRLSSVSEVTIAKKIKVSQKYEFFEEKITKKTDLHHLYNQVYSQHFEYVWNIAMNETTSTVLIHFVFPEEDYQKQLNRLKSTRHHGTLTELGNGRVDFSVTVQSELELVPWIRGYGVYAIVDHVTNPALAERIKNDWKEAMKQYGIIQ